MGSVNGWWKFYKWSSGKSKSNDGANFKIKLDDQKAKTNEYAEETQKHKEQFVEPYDVPWFKRSASQPWNKSAIQIILKFVVECRF